MLIVKNHPTCAKNDICTERKHPESFINHCIVSISCPLSPGFCFHFTFIDLILIGD